MSTVFVGSQVNPLLGIQTNRNSHKNRKFPGIFHCYLLPETSMKNMQSVYYSPSSEMCVTV